MRRLILGFALLAVAVTGCGSNPMLTPPGALDRTGTPGEGPIVAASRAARANFLPLQTGKFLGFSSAETKVEDPSIDYAIQVIGPAPRLGQGAVEVLDPEARSYLVTDAGGVRMVAAGEVPYGGVRRFVRPVRLVTHPLRVGRVWTDNFGSGAESMHVRHWVAGIVNVRTPAGNYQTFQIERRIWKGRAKPDFGADGVGRWTYYYAPGVGPVQIGTRWPGVTYSTYQLCATAAPALFKMDGILPGRPVAEPWHGLVAGLESLVRGER